MPITPHVVAYGPGNKYITTPVVHRVCARLSAARAPLSGDERNGAARARHIVPTLQHRYYPYSVRQIFIYIYIYIVVFYNI